MFEVTQQWGMITICVAVIGPTAGLLRTSSKDHYKCQLCYSRFERIAETLEALHKELGPPSASTKGKSSGNLPVVETARCAVNKILRQVEIHPEETVELET